MRKNGQIIIVEDDVDDADILKEIISELEYDNEIVVIHDSTAVVDYLKQSDVNPFLVISDINMPKMNGYELRDLILNDPKLKLKSIPYIFCSTSNDPQVILSGYKRNIQGFFHKLADYNEYSKKVKVIMDYWKFAELPLILS
ncbi:MAG: response regulator [Flavobacterium psychrophilum]|nr:MAG: response regulator [Flavobacterium psychrophilum]